MTDFAELGVSEGRAAILKAMGIVTPTPVQEETIPIVIAGHDVISQAQTGTGKTLAFVLPMLDKIKTDQPYVQGLIVTPTRELAIQITAEIKKLLTPEDGIKVLAVYGGQDVEAQLFKLKGSIHLVVATPGRLLDHIRRETITLGGVKMLVLDEADQMLHMGFLKEVEEILHQTPYKKQAMLFSATMPASIREMAGRILRNPQHVTVKAERVTVKDIRQWVVETSDRAKQDTLVKLLEVTQPYLSIIFCRTKRRANALNVALQELGYSSDELHGDLSQAKREQVMKRFRDARLQLLVATDIAARGLDVEGVTHVFNYDVPEDVESYIHRIGRTGRAGEKGLAITLIAPKDRRELADIENGIQMAMERRSEEGAKLGGGGLEGPRSTGGLGRGGSGGGRSARGGGAGQAKSRSGGAARGGDKPYGAGAGSGRGGDKRRGAVAKPGSGNRSSTGEWVDRGQSREAVSAGRGGRSSASAEASDEAIGFSFDGERGARGGRSAGAGTGRKPAGARGGFGRPAGAGGAGRAGGFGGRKSADERGGRSGAGFGRAAADERGAGRPSAGGGTSRRNSAERMAERAADNARAERGDSRGGGGFGRSSGGAGASGGFSKGGRSSGPRSGGGKGGFKGPGGPSGGGRSGGRGASRGR
ncbi:DEAD/DEAH box helicase [Cohnella luojiensis]|uniref:DEAD/DEAH box helicase n=1 Tax=Cohnella luojiensis TaxID=652876 RepID=A0A4Y8LV74_9BACL|nr:DEAD/DEAH box helicase [Cohnella luojiensis]TFE25408.1 DEAD/DEAH box helicase [Cohnella luojiensis]